MIVGGKKAANHYIIIDDYGNESLQSYGKNIVMIDVNNNVYLDRNCYKHSEEIVKYRNMFLNESSKEIENKIKYNIYKLTDLN